MKGCRSGPFSSYMFLVDADRSLFLVVLEKSPDGCVLALGLETVESVVPCFFVP